MNSSAIKTSNPYMNSKHSFENKLRRNLAGYFFILPALILISIFIAFSIVFILNISFFKTDMSFSSFEFVGLKNYKLAFTDKVFYLACLNTLVFSFVSIFFSVTFGFAFSVFLCFKLKMVKFFRTLFFVPTLLPNALFAAIYAGMFQYRYGTINNILNFLNLDFLAKDWLINPNSAYIVTMSYGVYMIGLAMLYYTSDLSTISTEVLESGLIDGANFRMMLTKIIFPLLINSHKTVTLTLMLTAFRAFEQVYILTGGGPGHTTEITGTYIYSFFTSESGLRNLGYVSTISILPLVLAMVVGVFQLRMYKRKA